MIDAVQMVGNTKNINLNEDSREKRGGTGHVDSGYGSAQIMGGFDFTLQNGNQFNVVATADGKIWKDENTTIKTGLTNNVFVSFEIYNNALYITNGADTPQIWDGSAGSTSNMTNTPTDWAGANQPTHMVVHGKGASERLWAIGALPYKVYAADLNIDGTSEADFSDANVVVILINTGDGAGIVAGIEFGDRLIVFGKNRTYIIDDTDTDAANWGHENVQWQGGVAHHRLLIRTPNDLVAMMENGDIYSVTTAEQYGDYKRASIASPAFIDLWFRQNASLSNIDKFHATYDSELRLIRWFFIRSGQTQVDSDWVYYQNRAETVGPHEAWMLHDNQSSVSGHSASASWNFRLDPPEDHRDYIYTGDYSGNVWDLEEVNRNDENNAYVGRFKTPDMTFEDPRVYKDYKRGWLITTAQGSYNVTVTPYVDGIAQTSQLVSLAGTGAVLGSFVLGTDVLGGGELLPKPFDIGAKGTRLAIDVLNSGVDETFLISQILVDFKPLGNRPQ